MNSKRISGFVFGFAALFAAVSCALNTDADSAPQGQFPHPLGAMVEKTDKSGIEFYSSIAVGKGITLPASVDLSSSMPPVGDQGIQGSCVAWAIGYALKTFGVKKILFWEVNVAEHEFSPSWVYNQINGGVDQGSYPSDAMNLIVASGCDTLSGFSYDQYNFTKLPDSASMQRASAYKSKSWKYVANDIDTMKAILAGGELFTITIPVYSDFDGLTGDNPVYDVISGSCRGYHHLCVVGYDDTKKAFKFINSWGKYWGLSGYGWIAYDLIRGLSNGNFSAYYMEEYPSVTFISNDGSLVSRDSETNYYGNEDFVTVLYRTLLGREPDGGGLQYWSATFKSWGRDREKLVRAFIASDEYFNVCVNSQYQALLGRSADGSGLQYWSGRLKQGLSQEGLTAEMCNSGEFWQISGADNSGFVERLYNKILQRASDGGGKQYWVSQLNGGQSRYSVACAFIFNAERYNVIVRQAYKRILGRDADGGGLSYWSGRMAGGMKQQELDVLFASSSEFWDNAVQYGLTVHPQVQYVSVPAIGSTGLIYGKAVNVVPSSYKIAVYIHVPNYGWVSKPYANNPYTSIASDGTWTCQYVTGGNDKSATIIAAFLVPGSYNPPVLLGGGSLSAELYNNAKAFNIVNR